MESCFDNASWNARHESPTWSAMLNSSLTFSITGAVFLELFHWRCLCRAHQNYATACRILLSYFNRHMNADKRGHYRRVSQMQALSLHVWRLHSLRISSRGYYSELGVIAACHAMYLNISDSDLSLPLSDFIRVLTLSILSLVNAYFTENKYLKSFVEIYVPHL